MKEIVMVYQEMSGDAIKCMLNVWAYLEPSGEAGEGTGRMPVGDRKTSQETKAGPDKLVRHGEALTKVLDAEEETNL